MAVDTRNKRASCLYVGRAFCVALPDPDGTIINEDQQQVAYSYPGILADSLAPVVGGVPGQMLENVGRLMNP